VAQSQPLVSVLVPTYNGAAFLDETLHSIHTQTYRSLEVIVRDDGSSDATLDIAEQYVAKDRRFRIVAEHSRGGGFANYIALAELAEGQFIKYCNQDDVLDPNCVRALLKPMLANPRIALSTSSRRLIDDTGAALPPRPYTAPLVDTDQILAGRSVAGHVLLSMLNQIGEPSTTLYRRRLVDPATMFDFAGTTFAVNCDLALWLSLLGRGELYFHAQPLSSFRIHGNQFSASPIAVLDGTLEWVRFLDLGLAEGLVTPGPALSATTGRLMATLHQQLGVVLGADEAKLRRYIAPLSQAIAATAQLATGQPSAALAS
jgi:glycosyltransferase involved in cell wall biosynthesis